MGIFGAKDPMEKWRKRNSSMAELVDRTDWQVDLALGVVTTVVSGTPVTVILTPPMSPGQGTSVLIEAGRQAEATLDNRFDNVVKGESFVTQEWSGIAEPGNGLIEGHFKGPDQDLVGGVVAAVDDLVARVGPL